ncbi:MAG TPA: hypothetical protein GX739_02735 [Firmicutes bacterium]|nr:hypothetical protein [Bacillota bacterium]
MNKMITLSLIITLLVVFSACAMAQETVTQQPAKAGTAAELDSGIVLRIIGAPKEEPTGSYDLKTGNFSADVSKFDGAYIWIAYDDIVVTGKAVVYNKQDKYLLVTGDVRVEQEDFILTGDKVEYYTELEKMIGSGNLEAKTNDAVVWANQMIYLKKEERVDFIENVTVETADAKLSGEHLMMFRATNMVEFKGSYDVSLEVGGSEPEASEPESQATE